MNHKSVFASTTNGTINNVFKYAWGENIGWLNFDCDNCDINITDSSITGYAWSTNYGWINLNPDNSGVENTSEGILSGFAWSSNLGWINFTGVTINSIGEFMGYATIESDNSRISFNCANTDSCNVEEFKVKTDWRPASARSSSGGGGSGSVPSVLPTIASSPIVSVIDEVLNFFNIPTKKPETIVIKIPKLVPTPFKLGWKLLPVKAIEKFVFAPLPYEIRVLADKFPELDKTLKSVGVERLTDISKLNGVTLNLPGLTELTNTLKNIGVERLSNLDKLNNVTLNIPGLSNLDEKMMTSVGVGVGTEKIALIEGLPLAKFSFVEKKNLPTEFVFARTNGELLDLNVAMSLGEKGEVTQKISSLPNKTLKLVVKPISKARNVTGYLVFKAPTPKISKVEISRSSLSASALSAMDNLVESLSTKAGNTESVFIENKLVLFSFEYTDPDHDGIYTADVISPAVPGEYEIISVIDYIDPNLGVRQMRMITVIDPEGYVFERNDGKETRIPSAIVSLYILNTSTKKYELWNAKNYQQENPQITDIRGTYSFLVPEGSYFFEVIAPGYETYKGKAFIVAEGSGIHQNIELKSSRGLLSGFDWRNVLLIVVLLLLVYNLSKDKLSKLFKKNDGK